MRLVTYDGGKVGYVDGDEIIRLEVPTMREWFENGGAGETGERVALADARLRAPIVPKKFFHTAGNFREHEEDSKVVNWSHEIAPWIVFFQNVDAIVGPDEPVVYPEHLTEELDYELEAFAVVLKQAGKWFPPEEAMDYVGRFVLFATSPRAPYIQRARDALGRLQLLQGDRHLLSARAVDRDAGRDPRSARPRDGAAGQRRVAAGVALRKHVRRRSRRSSPHLLRTRVLGGGRALDRHRVRESRASRRTRRRST